MPPNGHWCHGCPADCQAPMLPMVPSKAVPLGRARPATWSVRCCCWRPRRRVSMSSPTQPAGDWEPAPSAPGVIYTADLDDRLEGSSAPKFSLKQKPAKGETPQSVPALQDEADSTDLEAQRSALRRVNLGEDSKTSQVARDDLDEGPSTPPASSAAARADTKASSSPNSTAGGHLLSMCMCCLESCGHA